VSDFLRQAVEDKLRRKSLEPTLITKNPEDPEKDMEEAGGGLLP
jgi:hypothetical protein